MADVKMTKKMYYEEIKDVVEASGAERADEMVDFIDKQIAMLEAKAEKAQARAASKKVEGDALRDAVAAVLTDELQTIDDIAAQVQGEEVTKGKVTARLTQLVRLGQASKDMVKVGSRKVTAYKLA